MSVCSLFIKLMIVSILPQVLLAFTFETNDLEVGRKQILIGAGVDEIIGDFNEFTKLKKIVICNTNLGNLDFDLLRMPPSLKILEIRSNDKLSLIRNLNKLSSLIILRVTGNVNLVSLEAPSTAKETTSCFSMIKRPLVY